MKSRHPSLVNLLASHRGELRPKVAVNLLATHRGEMAGVFPPGNLQLRDAAENLLALRCGESKSCG